MVAAKALELAEQGAMSAMAVPCRAYVTATAASKVDLPDPGVPSTILMPTRAFVNPIEGRKLVSRPRQSVCDVLIQALALAGDGRLAICTGFPVQEVRHPWSSQTTAEPKELLKAA